MTHYELLHDHFDYAVEVLIDEEFDEFADDEFSLRETDNFAVD